MKQGVILSSDSFILIRHRENPSLLSVVVHAWVGKEFPDMRQNEGRIKLIRVGDALGTEAGSRKSQSLSWAGSQFL